MSDVSGLAPYAFATRLDGPDRPRAFPTVTALARHIEGRRFGQAIELVDIDTVEIPGRAGLFNAVQIFTLLLDNGRDRCIGYAWLGGQGRERLEPALRAVRRAAGGKAVAS